MGPQSPYSHQRSELPWAVPLSIDSTASYETACRSDFNYMPITSLCHRISILPVKPLKNILIGIVLHNIGILLAAVKKKKLTVKMTAV